MRLIEDGPEIPEDLLASRDEGKALFFCGAGVSAPSGLPGFSRLTEMVISALRADSTIQSMGQMSFDARFQRLVGKFGRAAVEESLFNALTASKGTACTSHRDLIDLATDRSGRLQLVTTNFDHLFEHAGRRIGKPIVAPFLPDLTLADFNGLVYLYGRLRAPEPGVINNYVVTSADFGRAYLAEGWATRFMRDLRKQSTIVFVGYSADDPPMGYLLQGMHANNNAALPRLYTFTSDRSSLGQWEEKGVIPIIYRQSDDHADLWATISAWAKATKNPDQWRGRLLSLARRSPSTLKPFERRQIVHLVSTADGARAFASANPPPPAAWLGVFDIGVRRSRPFRQTWHEADEVDPLTLFGLDNDPPRLEGQRQSSDDQGGDDVLRWRSGDLSNPERQRITPWDARSQARLTPRLFALSQWIARVMHQPDAVWWAAGAGTPHPDLAGQLRDRLDRQSDIPDLARLFWRRWLEAASLEDWDEYGGRWFELERRIAVDGWDSSTLREFARALQPRFKFTRGILGSSPPPGNQWRSLRGRFFDIEASIEAPGSDIAIPMEQLPAIVEIARNSLAQLVTMETELQGAGLAHFRNTPSLHPERDQTPLLERRGMFVWFAGLFNRLIEAYPDAASKEWRHWPDGDPDIFGKLVIWGAMFPKLSSGSMAAERILRLPDDVFWKERSAREMLFTLRARWPDFDVGERREIELRISGGPPRWRKETSTDHRRRKASTAASMFGWLKKEGCELSNVSTRALPRLIAANPQWRETWADNAAMSFDARTGWVEVNTDTRQLERMAPAAVIAMAAQMDGYEREAFREDRPFRGLVENFPLRALAALRSGQRRKSVPVNLWMQLLDYWPDNASQRLNLLFAGAISVLPFEAINELRYYLPRWLEKHLGAIIVQNQKLALECYDRVALAFSQARPELLQSSLGQLSGGSEVQPRSEVSVDKSINAPAGRLAEALLAMLGEVTESGSLPAWFVQRAEHLLALPGQGAGHAVCTFSRRLGWFLHWARPWAEKHLLALLNPEHALAEAAWHGFTGGGRSLQFEDWLQIKPWFDRVLARSSPWTLDPESRRVAIHYFASLSLPAGQEPSLFSSLEARSILRQVSDDDRLHVLHYLAMHLGKPGAWAPVGSLLENAWPKELEFRSVDAIVSSFANLAIAAGEEFQLAFRAVRPFLRAIRQHSMHLARLSRIAGEQVNLAQRFPVESLLLADILVGDGEVAYGLAKLLNELSEADPKIRRNNSWQRLAALSGI